jgi:anti-sigma factor RsiW
MEQSDPTLLVHAYCDDELDAVNALNFEARIAREPRLAEECDRIRALKQAVGHLPRAAAPDSLQRKIRAIAATPAPQRLSRPSWSAMAASVLVVGALSATTTWLVLAPADNVLSEEVIGSHMRALMASQPVDVVSSDRHTVKPWFNGKTTLAPKVPDFTAQGFPLVGGRIDVIGRTAVPALVYKRRQHLISLTAVPKVSVNSPLGSSRTTEGNNLVSWQDGALTYWAVSDVNLKDLEEFAALVRAAN